jgi:hypothetical protein
MIILGGARRAFFRRLQGTLHSELTRSNRLCLGGERSGVVAVRFDRLKMIAVWVLLRQQSLPLGSFGLSIATIVTMRRGLLMSNQLTACQYFRSAGTAATIDARELGTPG